MLRVNDPAQFRYRVTYAARCLIHGRTHTRPFDTCFEMGDGAEVVAALMHQATSNPRLHHAIHQWLTPDGLRQWQETAAAFPSLALRDLEATARQKHWTWVDHHGRSCSCAWCQTRSSLPEEVSLS